MVLTAKGIGKYKDKIFILNKENDMSVVTVSPIDTKQEGTGW